MLKSIVGVYRDGKVELSERPDDVIGDTRVIVTFLESGVVTIETNGIGRAAAADLRARLAMFDEEWSRLKMDAYDNYDNRQGRAISAATSSSSCSRTPTFAP